MEGRVPDSAIEDVGAVIDEVLAFEVFHADLHELLEGRVIAVVPVFEFVEIVAGVGSQGFRHDNNILRQST